MPFKYTTCTATPRRLWAANELYSSEFKLLATADGFTVHEINHVRHHGFGKRLVFSE